MNVEQYIYTSTKINRWFIYPLIWIMFIVALLLQFDKISIKPAVITLGFLVLICTIVKFFLHTKKPNGDKNDDKQGSNQGPILKAFALGLLIFVFITISMSLCIIHTVFRGYTNFWINLILLIVNIVLWFNWIKFSFESKAGGATISQLKFNGKYRSWGKNIRPASILPYCKVTPLNGLLGGEFLVFSEETFKITESDFKNTTNKEDGVVVKVKADDGSETEFNVVVKFLATGKINNTLKIATTEGMDTGAKEQLKSKIFSGLLSILSNAKDDSGSKPKKVEDFEPIRLKLASDNQELIKNYYNQLGFLMESFEITAIEKTTIEEKAKSEARAKVELAKGESEAETVKVNAGIANVNQVKTDLNVESESAISFVLATQGDSRRMDTNVTTPPVGKKGKGGKGGASAAILASLANAGDSDSQQ